MGANATTVRNCDHAEGSGLTKCSVGTSKPQDTRSPGVASNDPPYPEEDDKKDLSHPDLVSCGDDVAAVMSVCAHTWIRFHDGLGRPRRWSIIW